ncbi:unnamed protein product [Menidia menidia]|uniref:(Atlantic silverside) hypothetical protein n=1 Tax=Menidia menidia TaxID=238744 RepID=A0A8S4AM14_9TELE|nr:unnamed protein product [Menidia menidia]
MFEVNICCVFVSVATVNQYALKGLDKIEEKLPILHQPADKVVSDTVGMVYQSVAGAKDAVVGAVMGGVELTRSAVSTVMGTRMGQMVSSGMGRALSRSEDWVDQNLPLTERELAAIAEPPSPGSVSCAPPTYFVRLGKLSAKVQERALEQSLLRARHARQASYATLLLRWTEWQQKQGAAAQTEPDGPKDQSQQLEWKTLSMVRGLSSQLGAACSSVVSSAQGLPGAVQEQLSSARRAAEDLQASLGNTSSITPVLLEKSRQQLKQVQQSLDGVMEYLLHNTPLNWLVGPFVAQKTESPEEVEMEQTGPNN